MWPQSSTIIALLHVLQLNVDRGSSQIRIVSASGRSKLVPEHAYILDSLLAQALAVLEQHPHDAFELNSTE